MSNLLGTHIFALNAVGADAPEWLQLLPATSFSGTDGRGPYDAPDVNLLVSRFQATGRRIPIDENHSIDLAGKAGHPSPARGWIVEMQGRSDGVWGKVEWTEAGRALVKGKDYGFISPVFFHSRTKPYRIGSIERVALTNDPNLPFLKSLHSKEDTAMLEELRGALGLPETADEAAVLAAVKATHSAQTANVALMTRVAEAAGVDKTLTGDELVTALQSARASVKPGDAASEIDQLKGQVLALQNQLGSYVSLTAKDKAVAAIDKAIHAGKIVPALRTHYIERHQKATEEVEKEIELLPSLNAGGLGGRTAPTASGDPGSTLEDIAVMSAMGLDPKAFGETAKALHGKDL